MATLLTAGAAGVAHPPCPAGPSGVSLACQMPQGYDVGPLFIERIEVELMALREEKETREKEKGALGAKASSARSGNPCKSQEGREIGAVTYGLFAVLGKCFAPAISWTKGLCHCYAASWKRTPPSTPSSSMALPRDFGSAVLRTCVGSPAWRGRLRSPLSCNFLRL